MGIEGPSAPRRGRLRRLAARATGVLGWACFVLIGVALLIEHHPSLERWTERQIKARLQSPLAAQVAIESIDIRWLERAVAIRGVAMGPTGEELIVDEATFRIGWKPARGVFLDRVSVRGGSLVVSESLSPSTGVETNAVSPITLLADSPTVLVRDFDVSVDLPSGERLDVGRVDALLTPGSDTIAEVAARLVPDLGGTDQDSQVVWLKGAIDRDNVLTFKGQANLPRASLLDLEIEDPSVASALEQLAQYDPRIEVQLALDARYRFGVDLLPSVNARVDARGGSLRLPWLDNADSAPVEDVEIAVALQYAPLEPSEPFSIDAWSARGTIDARWQQVDAKGAVRMGRDAPPGTRFDSWVHIQDAPLDRSLVELSAGEKSIVELAHMLDPLGRADVGVGVRLPVGGDPEVPFHRRLERMILVEAGGDASLAYRGGVDRRTGRQNPGFPLRVTDIEGDVTWGIRPGARWPGHLGLYDLVGQHSGGPVQVQGSMQFQPLVRPKEGEPFVSEPNHFHLALASEGLPFDDRFREAVDGLGDLEEVRALIPTWNPEGGALAFELNLWRAPDHPATRLLLEGELDAVDARWSEFGLPVEVTRGTIRVAGNGEVEDNAKVAVQVDLEARADALRGPLHASGRTIIDGEDRDLMWFEVAAEGVNSANTELREELGRKNPGTKIALEESGVVGFFDLDVTVSRPLPVGEARAEEARIGAPLPYLGGIEANIEVRGSTGPSRVSVQPKTLPFATREVDGRLIAVTRSGRESDAMVQPGPRTRVSALVQGEWQQIGPGVPVVARVDMPEDGPPRIRAQGAGLDIANRSLVGALIKFTEDAARDEGGSDPFDTDAIDIQGRLDFGADLTLPAAPGLPMTDTRFGVDAYLDKLGVGRSQVLRDVAAHLHVDEATGQLVGDQIEGKLGETPVALTDLSLSSSEDGSVFRATIDAQGLPIDEKHLAFFFDPQTMRVVLEDLRARGTFDVNGAEVIVTKRKDGRTAVELDGELGVTDAFVDLGVPVEIARTKSMRVGLAHEGSRLRARAEVEGLYGSLAGRRLTDANLQFTYIEPRLVIEAFDGEFEGGRLNAIGGTRDPGADLMTLDLVPPFPFHLAASMRGVDVGQFLRGVFDSDFANRGSMDLSMQIEGDFEHLTEMEGRGTILVSDSALWAIPVFQALSVSLGIDTTVLFREMFCDYRIVDGALVMDRMRVDSDLLSLVGRGAITFEGDVTSDLEVRYRLIDKLGAFTLLLYKIQNSLLSVSVRGTMERPTVVLRGLISQFFAPAEERDRLPLPGSSERRRRF